MGSLPIRIIARMSDRSDTIRAELDRLLLALGTTAPDHYRRRLPDHLRCATVLAEMWLTELDAVRIARRAMLGL